MNQSTRKKTPPGWTPQQIKDAIYKEGVNLSAIARELGVTPPTVSDVIKGKSCSQRIHNAIAEVVKEDVQVIWPKFYKDGTPKRGPKIVVWHRKAA